MSQPVSQAVQERINELVQRTREKEKEGREKKTPLVSRAANAGEESPSTSLTGQETTTFVSKTGRMVSVERVNKRDESEKTQKTEDELGYEKELEIEEPEKECTEEHEMTSDDGEPEDELSIVEFEDPMYELPQSYELEPEYENMTVDQEAAEVQALPPVAQAEYRELSKLHQHQASIEKKMTEVSQIIKERTKARVPRLPLDLIKQHVREEPTEGQELHQMRKEQKTRLQIKQDEIPRTEKSGTNKGYYLFIEDDTGCLIEQPDGQAVQDTDTDQQLPTDLITEAEASTYQVPEQDEPAIDDDAETISSTSTANYNREEVEGSLTTISEAFHTIAQEYEKLTSTVPHMSKVQAAQVIVRLPVLPILKQEVKKEKAEVAEVIEIEPTPGTSTEQPAAGSEKSAKQTTGEVMEEQIVEREDDELSKGSKDKYFQRYMLTGKGKNPEEKVQQACKEINFWNLIVLIVVGDYIVNQGRNIKEAAKKWGLSFSSIQRAMSQKREHSVGRRQYAKRKRDGEKQKGPAKKSKQMETKQTTEMVKAENSQDSSDSTELPDVPWTRTKN